MVRWFVKLVRFGSGFDWISPVEAGIRDLEGPHRTILISDTNGRSPRNVARMLNEQGIETWGLMIVGDHFMVTVRDGDALRAEALLGNEGVTVDNPSPRDGQQRDDSGWERLSAVDGSAADGSAVDGSAVWGMDQIWGGDDGQ